MFLVWCLRYDRKRLSRSLTLWYPTVSYLLLLLLIPESGTVAGSAAVGVNIVTMTGIGESASLLPAMSSAPRRNA